ncbi:hypothetical protein WG907_15465 [Sphingobium sp. AN558]|uniref:hypothetical protein n=1 Tax=Sphingobium sp. AN558 TaxID=3133442 RepID=UPI0030BF407C
MPDIRGHITRVRDAANDIAGTAGEKLKDGTEKARESAGEFIQSGRDHASEAYSGARDKTQRAATRANEILQEHPVAAVAGAIAAGALIAWLFPKSRSAIRSLPGFASAASTRVIEAALAARAAAGESAESIKATATETLQHVRDSAGSKAASVRDTATSADLTGKASRIADELVSIVSDRIDAIGEAVKARLPRH